MTRSRFLGAVFVTLLLLAMSPASAAGTIGVAFEFNLDGNREGWGETNSVSALTVADGTLQCTVVGEDPYFESPLFSVNAAENPVVMIRMKVSAPGCYGLGACAILIFTIC